jgi:hypothetical protein
MSIMSILIAHTQEECGCSQQWGLQTIAGEGFTASTTNELEVSNEVGHRVMRDIMSKTKRKSTVHRETGSTRSDIRSNEDGTTTRAHLPRR